MYIKRLIICIIKNCQSTQLWAIVCNNCVLTNCLFWEDWALSVNERSRRMSSKNIKTITTTFQKRTFQENFPFLSTAQRSDWLLQLLQCSSVNAAPGEHVLQQRLGCDTRHQVSLGECSSVLFNQSQGCRCVRKSRRVTQRSGSRSPENTSTMSSLISGRIMCSQTPATKGWNH